MPTDSTADVEPLLLTVDQVAVVLACSAKTVRRLIEAGRLTPVRYGRRVLVERSVVEGFVRASRVVTILPRRRHNGTLRLAC